MFKQYVIALLLLSTVFCAGDLVSQSSSYEEGLAKCELIRKRKLESNPKGFVFIRPTCMEGAVIPEFEATTINGRDITRDDLLGKVVVINFWFIACQPCVAEIPGLNALRERYNGEDVGFIAISRDDEASVVKFLQDNTWEFDHIASEELVNDVFKIKWGYPTTFILNKKGEIVFATSGGMPDESAIEAVQRELIPEIESALEESP